MKAIIMEELQKLLHIMSSLRDPQSGCPWDREQDFETIAGFTLEEIYELIDAIERGDIAGVRDELGDLLFHVVFYGQIASEQGHFDFNQIVDHLNQKLVRRHPHVFGDASVKNTQVQTRLWEMLKREERRERTSGKPDSSILDGVGAAIPGITRAGKLQGRAAGIGFDWPGPGPVFSKIEEELNELRRAVENHESREEVMNELGDLLFACVNLARHLRVDPEMAIRKTNRKFENRFHYIEQKITADGKKMEDFTLAELDRLWDEAKERGI